MDLLAPELDGWQAIRYQQRGLPPSAVDGPFTGELSPGTYKDFMAAAVRKAFAAVAAITGMSITIAGSGPTYTVTRGAGDFIAGGIKLGMVGRLTAGHEVDSSATITAPGFCA